MANPQFQPIPGDPNASIIGEMFDARSEDWILAAGGGYEAAAVQVFKEDGSGFQNTVALQWRGRRNHSDELLTVRMMMAPEDAVGLASVLHHSGLWLQEYIARSKNFKLP